MPKLQPKDVTPLQPTYFTPQEVAGQGTKRFKCPIHGGSKRSVAVGYIDGRVWAKCWSVAGVGVDAASEYLKGILTPSGSSIQYQRADGQRGRHWRNPDKRRNPGVTGDGWQLRRFDPVDPSSATAICLAEGEKDAAILATAGLIAFTAPRGAQSLPLADFTELV